jgi:hypothetical protein
MRSPLPLLSLVLLLGSGLVQAQAPPHAHGAGGPSYPSHYDSRYSHNQSYPARGASVSALPHQPVVIQHPGGPYYYSGGVWYRPAGPSYVVVPAPVHVFVPVLPLYYTTVWYGGAPYYYANDTYYQWDAAQSGYEVVPPPQAADQGGADVSTQPPPSDQLFIYPQNGQSPEQQSSDQYECHHWAAGQSGFDPTQPDASGAGADARDAYQRAMRACLEGRGYSVR